MSKILGIDLGTTNSCMAVLEAGKAVMVLSAGALLAGMLWAYAARQPQGFVTVDEVIPPAEAETTVRLVRSATQSLDELRVWRLLIGESLRDDAVALAEARRLSALLEGAVDRWLGELFPELPADHADATTVVSGQLLAVFLEIMLLGDDPDRLDRRAAALAAVLFP
mgnify:CR=1 FL=1